MAVIGFDTRWFLHDLLWFLFIMSDCYWFRHTLIGAWLLVISIHHEWLYLVSTHGDWRMTSCEFYSSWVAVIGFDTRWLVNDFLCFLFIMNDCYWSRHRVIGAWPLLIENSPWVIVIGFYTRWLSHDLFRFLFTMSDCHWFLHTVIGSLLRVWKIDIEGTNRFSYIVMDSYTYSERSYTVF